MQQQKKNLEDVQRSLVNFQNIMLGVDGKSQKTTYSLILFCEAYKHAKLNMNNVLVKHSHTSYKECFRLFKRRKFCWFCLEDKDLRTIWETTFQFLIYFNWPDRVSA